MRISLAVVLGMVVGWVPLATWGTPTSVSAPSVWVTSKG
jgi:hypothetical protein